MDDEVSHKKCVQIAFRVGYVECVAAKLILPELACTEGQTSSSICGKRMGL